MARIRSFLAVDIGSAIRERAVTLQNELRSHTAGKWVSPESMHITLVFLGELDDRELFEVCRIATKVASRYPPLNIACTGLSAFPNERRPKILWSPLASGTERLIDIQTELSDLLVDARIYRREERDFTPHLTLGRIDGEMENPQIFGQYRDWKLGTHAVRELLVMGSELRRDGPEYTVLGRAEFRG